MAFTSEDLLWGLAQTTAFALTAGLLAAFKVVSVPLFISVLIGAALFAAIMVGIYSFIGEDNKNTASFRY